MQTYFNDAYRWRTLKEPLRARDALFGKLIFSNFSTIARAKFLLCLFAGGRTAASVLLAELSPEMIEAGYKISYYDFNSLVRNDFETVRVRDCNFRFV